MEQPNIVFIGDSGTRVPEGASTEDITIEAFGTVQHPPGTIVLTITIPNGTDSLDVEKALELVMEAGCLVEEHRW